MDERFCCVPVLVSLCTFDCGILGHSQRNILKLLGNAHIYLHFKTLIRRPLPLSYMSVQYEVTASSQLAYLSLA